MKVDAELNGGHQKQYWRVWQLNTLRIFPSICIRMSTLPYQWTLCSVFAQKAGSATYVKGLTKRLLGYCSPLLGLSSCCRNTWCILHVTRYINETWSPKWKFLIHQLYFEASNIAVSKLEALWLTWIRF